MISEVNSQRYGETVGAMYEAGALFWLHLLDSQGALPSSVLGSSLF